MIAFCRYSVPTPLLDRDPGQPHQAAYPPSADYHAAAAQLVHQTPATVSAPGTIIGLSDAGNQVRLVQTFSSSFHKSIVPAVADSQHMAAHPYRIFSAVTINKHVLYPDSLAKNAAAFFSISFSIFNRRFSSRRRLSSSFSAGSFPEPGKASWASVRYS